VVHIPLEFKVLQNAGKELQTLILSDCQPDESRNLVCFLATAISTLPQTNCKTRRPVRLCELLSWEIHSPNVELAAELEKRIRMIQIATCGL
jgi:hypothetical protein